MTKMANKAKAAAFRLHKLALRDLVRAKHVQKNAKLQRAIARKAAADVKKQLSMSEKVIAQSKKEQGKANKLWGALKKEQGAYDAEKTKAVEGVDDEEALDKKMEGEIADAEAKFGDFEKEEQQAEAAVKSAEELAEHAAKISEDSQNLLEATQLQQTHIDEERGWITRQEATMMAGRRGIASIEGELDVLQHKYFALRRALSGLEYTVPHVHVHHETTTTYANNGYGNPQPAQRYETYDYEQHPAAAAAVAPQPGYYNEPSQEQYEQQYVYPGMPLAHIIVPMPPHSNVDFHASSFQQPQVEGEGQQLVQE